MPTSYVNAGIEYIERLPNEDKFEVIKVMCPTYDDDQCETCSKKNTQIKIEFQKGVLDDAGIPKDWFGCDNFFEIGKKNGVYYIARESYSPNQIEQII